MKKTSHISLVLFLVSFGLGTPLALAAADPVESDTFRFTWLGIPIGETTLHYGSYENLDPGFGLESVTSTYTRVRRLKSQPEALSDNGYEEQKSLDSLRLGALEGRTNGLVRWLKRYEGTYTSTLSPTGSRYKVTAMDQGVPEARDIWFGAKPSDIPKVLDFRDRLSAHPLQPLIEVDDGSVDPVRLMSLVLKAVVAHNGCPIAPKFFRVFDGKRRYEARLSEPSWVDTARISKLTNRAPTLPRVAEKSTDRSLRLKGQKAPCCVLGSRLC